LEKRLRLAPSPTGLFHIGTARTALFNWLYAQKIGGKFLIRIEDTDFLRSKSEYTKNILEGLKWLGLKWDEEPIKQSDRISIHKSYIKKLLECGAAYRCFTSEDEISELREEQKKKGLPPKHDNRHRSLSKEEIETFISQGRTSVIRFKIDEKIEIKWIDQIRGEIKWQGKDLGGDLVLSRRAKGYEIGDPLYNLAVVVDDNFMNITHVVRGEDHISNTAKQILIYKALNFNLPTFSHTPLILNSEGKKLSKRDCVTSIDEFRDMGYLPEALANYMAFLGWSPKSAESEILSLDEISKIFDLSDINKAGAKFSWEKLNWINSQYIKNMESVKLSEIIFSISSGGLEKVKILYYNSIFSLIKKLNSLDIWTIGLDADGTEEINDVNLGKQNIAIFLGPEETGLSSEVKNKLDIVCRIEMTKDMESLNVSAAAAIAMNQIFIKK